jgi:hypothetical protein
MSAPCAAAMPDAGRRRHPLRCADPGLHAVDSANLALRRGHLRDRRPAGLLRPAATAAGEAALRSGGRTTCGSAATWSTAAANRSKPCAWSFAARSPQHRGAGQPRPVPAGHRQRREDEQRKVNPDLQSILFAPKIARSLLEWLRQRPLLHVDRTLGWAMVHAGLAPKWTTRDRAEARARGRIAAARQEQRQAAEEHVRQQAGCLVAQAGRRGTAARDHQHLHPPALLQSARRASPSTRRAGPARSARAVPLVRGSRARSSAR